MKPILYSFRRCPYAMRGRMALHIASIETEHREILLRDKPKAMLDVSPKGTVPVLILPNGDVIDESLDVMHWALGQNDPENWLAGDESLSKSLLSENDGDFKFNLDRYKYASRYDADAKRGDTNPEHQRAAEKFIQTLETQLTKSPYLLGEYRTLTDIAIFPFIRQFANTDKTSWENNDYPNTRNWLARHLSSDLFQAIMVKHPLWAE